LLDYTSRNLLNHSVSFKVKRLKQLLMETVVEDSVRARDSNGRTALHFASGTASCQSAELLVEAGAELECKDIDGYTALREFCTGAGVLFGD
jgi:ankyrin repeat protein